MQNIVAAAVDAAVVKVGVANECLKTTIEKDHWSVDQWGTRWILLWF